MPMYTVKDTVYDHNCDLDKSMIQARRTGCEIVSPPLLPIPAHILDVRCAIPHAALHT